MKFDVLSIHGNLIDIECHAYNGKHFTETWTLESTIKDYVCRHRGFSLKLYENTKEISVSGDNINKLFAINQLMNIAKFYNGDWKPNWKDGSRKYYIYFDNLDNKYDIESNEVFCRAYVYFKSIEDAQSVIDNPNFREILDEIFKS